MCACVRGGGGGGSNGRGEGWGGKAGIQGLEVGHGAGNGGDFTGSRMGVGFGIRHQNFYNHLDKSTRVGLTNLSAINQRRMWVADAGWVRINFSSGDATM